MEIHISKTDFLQLMSLISKAAEIIRATHPSPRDYNVARQLGNLKRKLEKRNNLKHQ